MMGIMGREEYDLYFILGSQLCSTLVHNVDDDGIVRVDEGNSQGSSRG